MYGIIPQLPFLHETGVKDMLEYTPVGSQGL